MSFKQAIPSDICLKCQICCRFPEKVTIWQPKLGRKEKASFKNKRSVSSNIKNGAIQLKKLGGLFCCSFLEAIKNSCRIYKIRPFDCRLYPFVLIDQQDKIVLAAHLICPFVAENIKTKEFKKYTGYLKKFFIKKETRDFLKANPEIIQDYQAYGKELIPLFPLTR